MNKVILMGRLTADPEIRQSQNGTSMCRFTVAVNRKFVDKSTGKREADFVSCTAWNKTAEFVSRYFSKGQMIAIDGTLRTGSYQDRNYADVTHYTTEVFVENVEFTSSKTENNTSPEQSKYSEYEDISGSAPF
ncbi:MAG: single-stranded DNA-binding protein [Ruminococcus sp.]|nr:single-stranded DNA-binding protein [Ruminococcus sp.]